MLAVRCEEDYLPDVEDPFWFFFHFSTFLLQYLVNDIPYLTTTRKPFQTTVKTSWPKESSANVVKAASRCNKQRMEIQNK